MLTSKDILIYNAGKTLFSKYGVSKVSIDMIVEKAGVAKGTFYLYFKNKQELYEKIIFDIFEKGKSLKEELYNEIPDLKERFFKSMLIGLHFFEKNAIIRNIVSGNKNYYTQVINQDYLSSLHTKMIQINYGDYFNSQEVLTIVSNVKKFYIEVLNLKKTFLNQEEYEKFVVQLAAILTNGLFSNYKILYLGKEYKDLLKFNKNII